MDVITLEASPRGTGKQAAKAVRREGNVPCVLYGSHQEPVTFQVPELSLRPLIYTQETHRVTIKVDGGSYDCILKDLNFHPVTERPIHADFQVLAKGEHITMTVPVHYEGSARGVRDGGDLQVNVHELTVRVLPENIPGHIAVDISELGIGDSLHMSDIDVPNVEFVDEADRTLVTVLAPRVEAVEGEEDEAALGFGAEEAADAEEASDEEAEA